MENTTEAIPVLVRPQRHTRNFVLIAIGVLMLVAIGIGLAVIAAQADSRASAAQRGQQAAQQQNNRLQGQLGTLEGQLKTVEAKLNAPKAAAQPAIIAHLGVCVNQYPDSTTGDLLSVSITAPTDSNGVFSCTSGSFVPVAPTGSGG